MATINKASKLNDVSCENISKIDDVLKSNIRYFDDNDFSCLQTTPTPTPTPTITPTITPTRTQTPTPTRTLTPTPTRTLTPTPTRTLTPTPTITPTSTPPSVTPTPTPTTPATCIVGTIPKDTNYEYKSCCYPYGQITGTAGGDGLTVCFDTTGYRLNVTGVGPACEVSGLTGCCEIELNYDEFNDYTACLFYTPTTYYISIPCESLCIFNHALGIYTDISCTTLAPDGYYSDGMNYGTVSGGVFTFNGSC